jgi:hypothetical protein
MPGWLQSVQAADFARKPRPTSSECALEAERMDMESQGEQQRIIELELQQTRYEASLAERRYAASRRVGKPRSVACKLAKRD